MPHGTVGFRPWFPDGRGRSCLQKVGKSKASAMGIVRLRVEVAVLAREWSDSCITSEQHRTAAAAASCSSPRHLVTVAVSNGRIGRWIA